MNFLKDKIKQIADRFSRTGVGDEEKVKQILDQADVPQAARDYILFGSGNSSFSFHAWQEIFKLLLAEGYHEESLYPARIIRRMVEEAYLSPTFVADLWGNKPEHYVKLFKILEKSGLHKIEITAKMLMDTFSFNTLDRDSIIVEALKEFLFPTHREECKEVIRNLPPGELDYGWVKLALEGDYDYFKETVKLKLGGESFRTRSFIAMLMMVKDKEFIKEIILKELQHWVSDTIPGYGLEKTLAEFVAGGVKPGSFEKDIAGAVKKISYWDNTF
ncbi:MAG: hypothetical protein GY765_39585, partial [bacterium]|nr:hypothetical protein [bacterium]